MIKDQDEFTKIFYSVMFAVIGNDRQTREALKHGWHYYELGIKHQKEKTVSVIGALLSSEGVK